MPRSGGSPAAMEKAIASGSATSPTTMPAANADLTVAVSVSGLESDVSDDPAGRPTRERLNRLWRSTSALLDRFSAGATPFDITDIDAEEAIDEFGEAERGNAIPKLRSFAVMMRTIDIAQAALARHQMAAYPPDVLIEVPRTACRSLDFHRAAEVIELGHELAARALDRFEGGDLP